MASNFDREKLIRHYLERKYKEGALSNITISKPTEEQRRLARLLALSRADKYNKILNDALSKSHEEKISRRIINYLKESSENIFNTDNTPVSIRILSEDLNENSNIIRKVCGDLAKQGLLQEISIGRDKKFYRFHAK
jgi:hypothetical protein